jgi:uncharacterized protein YcfJ
LLAAALGSCGDLRAQYAYVPPPDYYRNNTLEGTVAGGAFGAITGAILGGRNDRGEGALIGAGVGALAGNLLGRSKDTADVRRANAGATAVAYANQQAAARAVTNYDLIRMTEAGLGDDVIVSTLRARGARLDLSPEGVIALNKSGVSDRVIMAAQDFNGTSGLPGGPAPTLVADPPPPAVIVAPHPYWYPPCPPYYCPGPYYGTRIHYHVGF